MSEISMLIAGETTINDQSEIRVMKSRVKYIDAMRGLAILTVVIGHLVQRNIGGGTSHPLFDLIYSFHMPLFFFICGCAQWLSYSKFASFSLKVTALLGGA